MRKTILSISLASTLMLVAVSFATAQNQSYSGVITANQIASTGGSSSLGLWMKRLNCHDERDCAQRLVRAGGKYVLVTAKSVYPLSDQTKAALFAGARVTVAGTYDPSKKTIEVADVQAYNASAASAGLQ
jgi:hypothetical protein